MSHPVLQKLECFGPLDDEDRRLLRHLVSSERAVPARTDLIREGDDPTVVHLVTSGFACRYKRLSDGKRQIVAFLVPGDFCDPYAFILKQMDHSIATLAPSRIAAVPRQAILELLSRPALAKSVFMAALVDGATLREWIANVGQRNSEQRIAHFFCEIFARLRAVGLAREDTVALPISQADLSDTVGLSLVHTNRSLKSLRDAGLITFKGGTLVILDPSRLEMLCGFTPNYLHLS